VVREIPGPAGQLEVLFDKPKGEPRVAVVFAHPLPTQGGTMHTKVVFQAAKALAEIGCVVLRFNFRGVGRSARRVGQRARRAATTTGPPWTTWPRSTRAWRCGRPASRSARTWR
jgi:predicted alpha/beta-hydrolase family hydrolase